MNVNHQLIQEKRNEIIGPEGFFALEDRERYGQTYKAFKHAPATVAEIINNARNHGDAEYVVYEGRRYTYAGIFAEADAIGVALQARGIGKGDRVAIAMRNCPEWIIAYAAITLIGGIAVPINSWGKTEELVYAVTDSGSKILICDPQRYKLVQDRIGEMSVGVIVSDIEASQLADGVERFDDLLAAEKGKTPAPVEMSLTDPCLILYTSGSTGMPKGVLHLNEAVTQSLFNMMCLGMLMMSLEGAREFRGGSTVETPLQTVPLFHCTGLLAGFVLPIVTAQKVVIMYKWDTVRALELIQEEKVTSLSSVPAIVQDLLAHPEFDNYQTESLIRVTGAGAATPAGLPELIHEKCGNVSRSAGYGMTETMAVCASMSGCLYDYKPEASGLVAPIMQVRTVDTDGNVLPQGEAGEIEMRGICCMVEYWEKPEANEKTFMDDRWMKTGDVGYVDDEGFIYITGRIKEIVIRGGENIYPGEIEYAAYELDQVHECVVFGEPDAAMGEELVMVVYRQPGTELDEAELRESLKARLANYKVPRTIIFSDQPLPRNASEKLHKLKVKEAYLAEQESAPA